MTTNTFPTIECEKFDYEKYHNEKIKMLLENRIKYYNECILKVANILKKIKNFKNIESILKYHKTLILYENKLKSLFYEKHLFKLKLCPYDTDNAVNILFNRIEYIDFLS